MLKRLTGIPNGVWGRLGLLRTTSNDSKQSGDAGNSSTMSKTTLNSDSKKQLEIPEPPTNCCMSGCANCVWIVYSEDLLKIWKDANNDDVRKLVLNQIEDTNMKAFLGMELRNLMNKRDLEQLEQCTSDVNHDKKK